MVSQPLFILCLNPVAQVNPAARNSHKKGRQGQRASERLCLVLVFLCLHHSVITNYHRDIPTCTKTAVMSDRYLHSQSITASGVVSSRQQQQLKVSHPALMLMSPKPDVSQRDT